MDRVKVGYREYVIRYVPRKSLYGGDAIGDCENPGKHINCKGKIRIANGLDNVEKANTVLHEIMHALFYTQGINVAGALEERLVCSLTNGLIAFIRDNPKFVLKLLRLALKR
jgi:hypothetical protein